MLFLGPTSGLAQRPQLDVRRGMQLRAISVRPEAPKFPKFPRSSPNCEIPEVQLGIRVINSLTD